MALGLVLEPVEHGGAVDAGEQADTELRRRARGAAPGALPPLRRTRTRSGARPSGADLEHDGRNHVMDTGRFLLAVVLVIGVIIATNLMFPPIPPAPPPDVRADSAQVDSSVIGGAPDRSQSRGIDSGNRQ